VIRGELAWNEDFVRFRKSGIVFRVVCVETEQEIRVLTAFFDRDARTPS
jgi:hypothetical protein